MNIYEKLLAIQEELSVPKNQHNGFGNYNYRSCEDILEKVKPLCKKNHVVLKLYDELECIGDRYYVKAVAELINYEADGIERIFTTAYAREEESKKGMDGSQVTGASSSYARKYALNGLFCIDDVKDSDFTNTGEKTASKPPVKAPAPASTNIRPAPQKAPAEGICVACGATVNDKVRDYSVKKFGQCFCMDCQKKYAR